MADWKDGKKGWKYSEKSYKKKGAIQIKTALKNKGYKAQLIKRKSGYGIKTHK